VSKYSEKILNVLKNNDVIKDRAGNMIVEGESPWHLQIDTNWKGIGNIKLSSFDLSDFFALRDWWINTLNYNSKRLMPIFPVNEKLDRFISNHYKNHISHRDIIFNLWLLKGQDGVENLDNEIIGHFFLNRCDTKPEPGLAVADKFQHKKLGTFAIWVLIYITKLLGKKVIFIRTDKNNTVSFKFYKELGFKHIKDIELEIPVVNYKGIIHELEMELDTIKI
jgi:RimJ/RimL family protein N-acetyltransferase